ncbi:hypothetical protein [Providencia burhodogranariea]|uniref:hypothetical protein n=1 Tax=Providencia burhodogranariea TaxID=516074 RepID=UPI0002DE824C|nr:hypothetical protein [Providencia burhodogranariea]
MSRKVTWGIELSLNDFDPHLSSTHPLLLDSQPQNIIDKSKLEDSNKGLTENHVARN